MISDGTRGEAQPPPFPPPSPLLFWVKKNVEITVGRKDGRQAKQNRPPPPQLSVIEHLSHPA